MVAVAPGPSGTHVTRLYKNPAPLDMRPVWQSGAASCYRATMITRGDILMLGIGAGVSGGLIGGMMLGLGISLVMGGVNIGWILLFIGAPSSALVGWIMARRLAKQLTD